MKDRHAGRKGGGEGVVAVRRGIADFIGIDAGHQKRRHIKARRKATSDSGMQFDFACQRRVKCR